MGLAFDLSETPISPAVLRFDGQSYSAIYPTGLYGVRSLRVLSGLFQDSDQPTLYLAGQSPGPPYTARAMRHEALQFAPAAPSSMQPFAKPTSRAITAGMAFDPDGVGGEPPSLVVASRGISGEVPDGVSYALQPFHRWNGRSFEPFAPGEFNVGGCCAGVKINAMSHVDPDGFGPLTEADGFAVGGNFDSVELPGFGQHAAYDIAVWNGSFWIRPNELNTGADIRCLTALPPELGGGGPALFVGGNFNSIGGVSCSNAALWLPNGPFPGWHGMFAGVDGTVHDAVIFDPDGSGTDYPTELYVAGEFMAAGGLDARGIATWNGTAWNPLYSGDLDGPAFDLQLWDRDGPGGNNPALAAAGMFTSAGFISANGVARLNAIGWEGLGNAGASEFGTDLAVLDPDGSGSAGEKLYAVLSNLAANRRFVGLRQIGVMTSVWDDVGFLGPTPGGGEGIVSLVTVDDDGPGLNTESIVVAGDMPSSIAGIPTNGLIRLATPRRFLVDSIYATLNGAGAYVCGQIAGMTDDVIFDYTALTGNPDAQGYADLIGPMTIGTLNVLSGNVSLDLSGNDLILTQPTDRPSLVLGEGRLDAVSLRLHDDATDLPIGVSAQNVVIAGMPAPHFVPHDFYVDDVGLRVDGTLSISREGAGGYMVVLGNNGRLQTFGDVSLGGNYATNGELFVFLGASWTHSGGGMLEVGQFGYANLDIDTGAVVATNFDTINIAAQPGSSGILDIGENGAARWTQTGGSLFVGHQGSGLMKVRNASTFTGTDHHLVVGHLPGSSGELFVSDNGLPNAAVSVNELSIGRFGGDGLLLLDGGDVRAFNITIGRRGTVKGTGRFVPAGTLINQGLLSPGAVPDDGIAEPEVNTIQIDGNYTQVSAPDNQGIPGRLAIDIGRIGPPRRAGPAVAEADHLVVSGIATLGGQLDVRLADGFTLMPGELLAGVAVISSDNPIVGAFDVANFPGLTPGVTGSPRFLRFENRTIPGARGTFEVVVVEDTLASPPPAPAAASQDYDVGGAGTDADLGDLNGDGILDIAITVPNTADPVNSPGSVVLLFNAGSVDGFWQGFTSSTQITVAANPSAIVIADFDGVLGRDICFTSLTDATVHVMLNDGAGNFSFLRGGIAPLPVSGPARHLIKSDFNLDGGVDVAVITEGVPTLTILFNSRPSTGIFTGFINEQVIPIPPTSADGVAVDIDNDKWDDIVIPNDDDESITIQNNGPGALRGGIVFNPVPILVAVPGGPTDVDAADLNLDGFNDVAFAARTGDTVTILLGNGTPTFLPPITVPAGDGPSDLALIDLDNDNDDDVAVITTDEMGQRIVRVIRNDLFGGQLSFATQTDLVPGATPELVLGGDVTGDGNPDLVTVNNAGGVRGGAGPADNDVSVFTFAVCGGDANNDRVVDMADISATLTSWLVDYRPGTGPGDSNGDGAVTFADITSALGSWGRDCR